MSITFPDQPLEPFGEVLLDIRVPSDLGFKTPLIYRIVQELQANACIPHEGIHMAELCFEEAMVNAMMHGNSLDSSKTVRCIVCCDDNDWAVILQDEGAGFQSSDVPDPDDPSWVYGESGRGLMLMDHYLDRLEYGDRGRRCRMIHHKYTQPTSYARKHEPISVDAEIARAAQSGEFVAEVPPTRQVMLPDELELDLDLDLPATPSQALNAAGNADSDGDDQTVHVSVAVIRLPMERITEDTAAHARQALVAASGQQAVVVDMSSIEFMSSVGLSTIMTVYKDITAAKGKMILAALKPELREIFKATGLLRLLKIEPTVEGAVAKLESGA